MDWKLVLLSILSERSVACRASADHQSFMCWASLIFILRKYFIIQVVHKHCFLLSSVYRNLPVLSCILYPQMSNNLALNYISFLEKKATDKWFSPSNCLTHALAKVMLLVTDCTAQVIYGIR